MTDNDDKRAAQQRLLELAANLKHKFTGPEVVNLFFGTAVAVITAELGPEKAADYVALLAEAMDGRGEGADLPPPTVN